MCEDVPVLRTQEDFVSAHCGILQPCEFQVAGNLLTRWSTVSVCAVEFVRQDCQDWDATIASKHRYHLFRFLNS